MPNIFDTAKYILKITGPISMWLLQGLCYYAKAWSLVWDDDELFPEHFEAWAGGPVCPELLHRTTVIHEVDVSDIPDSALTGASLSADQMDTIDGVVRDYVHLFTHLSDDYLRMLATTEDPWIFARNGLPPGAKSSNPISEVRMRAYYRYQADEKILRRRYRREVEKRRNE